MNTSNTSPKTTFEIEMLSLPVDAVMVCGDADAMIGGSMAVKMLAPEPVGPEDMTLSTQLSMGWMHTLTLAADGAKPHTIALLGAACKTI